MTFDFDPATQAALERARAVAAAVRPAAATIDATAAIPEPLRRQARAALAPATSRQAWVVGLEELASVSGSVAVDAAWPADAPTAPPEWPGLRGVALLAVIRAAAEQAGGGLGVAAVLVGLGRAALDAALEPLRAARTAGRKPEYEQWGLADAATEIDAARLLVWQAAASPPGTGDAMARLQARLAADAAVAAARRVLGADGTTAGSVLDRVGRDVATAAVVFGGPDADESAVASGLLPG